jgi:hypothetical protein
MRWWRRIAPMLAFALLSGCHRVSGYGKDAYGEGTMRHYAGLDIGYRATLALCGIAIIVGSIIVLNSIVQPERYDRRQTAWGAVLVVLAILVGVRVHSGFGNIGYCC